MRNILLILMIALGSIVQAQSPMVALIQNTYVEPTPVNDSYYEFDGSSDSYFTTDFDLNGQTEFSGVVWMSIDTDLEEHVYLGAEEAQDFMFRRHSNGNNWLRLQDAAGNVSETSRAITFDTQYHQMAFRYDTTNGIELFMDGVSLGAPFDTDFTGFTTPITMTIAKKQGSSATILKGKMKEIQIYDRALTDQEFANLNTDITNTPSGLIADFAGNKTQTTWTDNISGYVATNQGGVTIKDDVPSINDGSSYYFDGVAGSYMTTDFDLNGQNDNTFIIRARIDDGSTERTFVGSAETASLWLRYREDPTLDMRYDNFSTSSGFVTWVNDGLIHDFAMSWDSATTTIKMFVDGVEIYTEVDGGFNGWDYSDLLKIGSRFSTNLEPFSGNMFDIKMYSTALSEVEHAQQHSDNSNTKADLILHFGNNKTALAWTDDVSGNVATPVGGAVYEKHPYDILIDKAETLAYGVPSLDQQVLHRQLVDSLIWKGVWYEEDVMYIPANDGSREFSTLNWKDPDSFQLVDVNTATQWVSNVGFDHDGTTVLNTQWDMVADNIKYQPEDGSASIYVTSHEPDGTTFHNYFGSGQWSGSRPRTDFRRDDADTWSYRAHSNNTGSDYTAHPPLEFISVMRDSSLVANAQLYYNGLQIDSSVEPIDLTVGAGFPVYIAATNYNGQVPDYPSNITWAYFGQGSGQQDVQQDKFNIIDYYMYAKDTSLDVFPQDNAASYTDSDSVGSITDFNATVSVDATEFDSNFGQRSIKVTSNFDANTAEGIVPFTTEVREVYKITVRAKQGQGTEQELYFYDGVNYWNPTVDSATWETYTFKFVSNASSNELKLRASGNASGLTGDVLWVDNIKIVKIASENSGLFPVGNSASRGIDEVNSTSGWTANTATVTSTTEDVQNEAYSIKVDANSAQTYARGIYAVSGLEIGEVYGFDIYAKKGTLGDAIIQGWLGTVGNITPISVTETWTRYLLVEEADDTTVTMQFYVTNSADAVMYVDNVSINVYEPSSTNLIGNGIFDGNDSTGWNLASGWSVSNNELVATASTTVASYAVDETLVPGDKYYYEFEITSWTAGDVSVRLGDAVEVGSYSGVGIKKGTIVAGSDNNNFGFDDAFSTLTMTIDNVKLHKINN